MWERKHDILRVYCLSKGLYGYSIMGFSSTKNITNAYFLRSHVQNYVLINKEFSGNLSAPLVNLNNSEKFVFKLVDFNTHPVPLADKLLWSTVEFNITLFQKHFKIHDKIWVYLGMKENFLPTESLEDDMKNLRLSEALIMNMNFNTSKFSKYLIFIASLNLWYFNTQVDSIVSAYFGSWIPTILILCLLFVLFVVLGQFQPLKSRGIIPFLAFFRFFFSSFFHYNHFGQIEHFEFTCYYNYFIFIPLTFSGFFLIALSMLRYVVIANLNNRKQQVSKTKKSQKNVFLIFLKYSIHPVVTFIIWILFIFIFICIDIGLVVGFKCETNLQGVTPPIAISLYVVIIGLCSTFFIFDILSNIKRIFSKWGICNLFWKYDAYYFRTEYYIFGLGVSAWTFIIITIIQLSVPNIPNLAGLIFGFILDFTVFFFQSGFPLLMTIINLIIRLFRKKKKGYLIETLLENLEFHEMFNEFAKSEWSTENLACYDDIIEFEKNVNSEKANEMMNLYFNGASSELEVNVPGTLLVGLKEKIQKGKLDENLFSEVKSVVVSNLLDTNSRFMWTWEYKQFMFKNEAFGANLDKK
eukprot:gene2335-2803_t